jgi:integrase
MNKKTNRKQTGCIREERGSWTLRWRETVQTDSGPRRKMRFKVLGDVTEDQRRNKDRKTGKLRIPADIEKAAAATLAPLNALMTNSVLTTIGQVVGDVVKRCSECRQSEAEHGNADHEYRPEDFATGEYFRHAQKTLKGSTFYAYQHVWRRHLKARVQNKILRDFKRSDAFDLWQEIHDHNSKLGRQTLSHCRFFLSAVFEFCLNRGLYDGRENPCRADLPAGLAARKRGPAYTTDEVNRLLKIFIAPQARAIFAIAWAGLRKGEIAGLEWRDVEHLKDGCAKIHVRRSVWQGQVTTPKTEASADAVIIGSEIVAHLTAFGRHCGNPTEGFVFPGVGASPINLDSFARWQIIPVLNRCAVCKKAKHLHPRPDHEYQRDSSMPEWKGFHGFRRGSGRHIAENYPSGDGMRAAQVALRHSDEGVTSRHYVQPSGQEKRALAARRDLELENTRNRAAATLSAGLKSVQ